MTVYEQVQKAVDFIEDNLYERISCDDAAGKAHMSLRSFYNYFWAVTGFRYGEYLRKRRLSEALILLRDGEDRILNIALDMGYESHEAFTRAFKTEFGLSPLHFRKSRLSSEGLGKINVIEEMYMGIVIKKLPEMKVVSFTGFSPEPENKAHDRIWAWAKENGYGDLYGEENQKPYRLFGHDTDSRGEGFSATNYDNYGYKLMLTLQDDKEIRDKDLTRETLKGGKFAVTGVEGDPEEAGEFIPLGWQKMMNMAKEKGFKVKGERWLEEKLKASEPNLLRLDLYLEIED